MPGPKTHDIIYKRIKSKLSEETLKSYPHYDDYRIFAQGHDFLIYHDFYKIRSNKHLNENLEESALLQEYYFPEFVYSFLKSAERNNCLQDEQVRLFIGPGYVMHHMLDSYTHPYIIYYSGDHIRDIRNRTWEHGIMENLLDIYFMRKYEGFDYKTPVHSHFAFNKSQLSPNLIKVLDESLMEVYGMSRGGLTFSTSMGQVKLYVRALKDDRYALKRAFFDLVDPFFKGTSSFSYNRKEGVIIPALNLSKHKWCNPMDGSIISTASLLDLVEQAITDGVRIIEELERIIKSGKIDKDEVFKIIPNIASTHGLECNQKMKINHTRKSLE